LIFNEEKQGFEGNLMPGEYMFIGRTKDYEDVNEIAIVGPGEVQIEFETCKYQQRKYKVKAYNALTNKPLSNVLLSVSQ
jgi:hypothetical protein